MNRFSSSWYKKIGSVIGVMIMMVFVVPHVSFADGFTGTGSGTSNDPFIITSCTELQEMGLDPTSYFKLNGPSGIIDCSATATWNDNGDGGFYGFAPIQNFGGTLDGNNNTITNLYINRPAVDSLGLFGTSSQDVTIHDLTLVDENITGNNSVGGLFGYVNNGLTLTNVTTSGTISGHNGIGGLVGSFDIEDTNSNPESVTLAHLQSTATVHGTDYVVGGLFGYIYANRSSGSVSVSFTDSSHTTGAVDGYAEVGGVVGELQIYNSSTDVSTNTFSGLSSDSAITTTAGGSAGGLFGYTNLNTSNDAGMTTTMSGLTHTDGVITSASGLVGGIWGTFNTQNDSTQPMVVTLSDAHSTGDISTSGSMNGGIIGSAEWYADGNGSSTISLTHASSAGTITGGSDTGGIIGESDSQSYDAQLETVTYSNLSSTMIENGGEDLGGLVGYLYNYTDSSGSLTVDFTDSYHDTGTVSGTSDTVGGIIGYADIESYSTSEQSLVSSFSGLHSDSDVLSSSGYYIGGVVGYFYENQDNDSIMTTLFTNNYHNTGTVIGNYYIGGVIGYLEAYNYANQLMTNTFSGLHSDSAISSNGGANYMGGLMGYFYVYNESDASTQTTISDSYHETGEVYGSSNVGGLIGEYYVESESSNSSNNILSGLYNTTNVIGDGGGCIGGLIGCSYDYNYGNGINTLSFTNSYQNDGHIVGDSYVGGITGYYQANAYNDSGDLISHFSGLHSNSAVTVNGDYGGGLLGMLFVDNHGTEGTIHTTIDTSYHDTGTVYAGDGDAGGIAGSVWIQNTTPAETATTFSKMYNTSNVTENSIHGFAGGLYGYLWNYEGSSNTPITVSDNYYADGTVTGNTYVGGITSWANMVDISNSYTSGSIVSNSATVDNSDNGPGGVGGLVGEMVSGVGSISNSFSTAQVSSTDPNTTMIAGLVGYYPSSDITLTNNYYAGNQQNCALDDSAHANNNAGQCQIAPSASYFINNHTNQPLNSWNFSSIWYIHDTLLPTFTGVQPVAVISVVPVVGMVSGGMSFLPNPMVVSASTPLASTQTSFSRNLKLGDSGTDVAMLQVYLEHAGFPVAKPGKLGSKGHYTKTFGIATKKALMKFQMSHGIMPTGNLGDKTRSYITSHA